MFNILSSYTCKDQFEIGAILSFPGQRYNKLIRYLFILFLKLRTYYLLWSWSQPPLPLLPILPLQIPPYGLLPSSSEKGRSSWVPPHPGTSRPSRTRPILSHWGPTMQSRKGKGIQWQGTEIKIVPALLVRGPTRTPSCTFVTNV